MERLPKTYSKNYTFCNGFQTVANGCRKYEIPGPGPERRIDEVQGYRFFEQHVMRVVIGHHRRGDVEPPCPALTGTVRRYDLDNRCAHEETL